MGRARGTGNAAAVADQFAAVLGTRRGTGSVDLGARPNSPAHLEAIRRANTSLFKAVRHGEIGQALEALRANRDRLDAPVVAELHTEVATALGAGVHGKWGPVADDFVSRVCQAKIADTIVTGPDKRLHLWPDGKQYGVRLAEGESSRTACGLDMQGTDFPRSGRNSWARSEAGHLNFELCPNCAEHEDNFDECADIDEDLFAPAAQQAFFDDLEVRCTRKLTDHITAPRKRNEKNLLDRIRSEYRQAVVEHAYRRIQDGGAGLAERLLATRSPEPLGITDAQVQAMDVGHFADMVRHIERYTLGGKPHPDNTRPAIYNNRLDELGANYRTTLKIRLDRD